MGKLRVNGLLCATTAAYAVNDTGAVRRVGIILLTSLLIPFLSSLLFRGRRSKVVQRKELAHFEQKYLTLE